MLSDRSHAETHIASVGKVRGGYLLLAVRADVGSENQLRLLHRETGSLHIVCQHPAVGSHYIRVLHEKALGDPQIVWVKIEIIIDKKQNVAVPSEAKDRIALPGKPQVCLDERYIWKSIRRIAHIRQVCVRYQDLVWLSLLLCQKGNRLDEDCGASASSNTNHQIRSCI